MHYFIVLRVVYVLESGASQASWARLASYMCAHAGAQQGRARGAEPIHGLIRVVVLACH